MKRGFLVTLALCCLTGCGERPAPIGPAAEASTAEVEITMDMPTIGSDSTGAEKLIAKTELGEVR